MKGQTIYDGPVLPEMAPAIDVQWISGTTCQTIFGVQGNDKRYFGVVDDADFLSEVPAEVVENIDDIFSQKALWKSGGGLFFSATACLVIARALQWLSKNAPTLGIALANLVRTLADNVEASLTAGEEGHDDVEQKQGFCWLRRSLIVTQLAM